MIYIAVRIVHGGVPLGPLETCVFGTVVRGIRLTLGAAALIEKRLQGEAFILGRSLFEDSLRMAEIGHDTRGRKGLMLGWYFASLAETESLHTEAKVLDLEANTWKHMPASLRSRDGTWKRWRPEIRSQPSASLSVKDAAKHFGRLHDYWTYRLAHEMAHGSDIAHTLYGNVDRGGDGLPQMSTR